MVKDVLYINGLNVKEFFWDKRGILSHHSEIRTSLAILWHHLVC